MAIAVKPNIATFIRRESSAMPPGDLPAAALAFVNQLSAMDIDVDYVTLRFDSQTHELGLTYSDALKTSLGLADNHYTLVAPAGGGGGGNATTGTGTLSLYFDPFNTPVIPLSLPLPEAYLRVSEAVAQYQTHDHVIVWVSATGWDQFYSSLLAAGARFPDFAVTAQNVQQRFGFVSSPAPDLPEVSVIRAGESYTALADWIGRYDQVFSAVLVMRFAAGAVPGEYL